MTSMCHIKVRLIVILRTRPVPSMKVNARAVSLEGQRLTGERSEKRFQYLVTNLQLGS